MQWCSEIAGGSTPGFMTNLTGCSRGRKAAGWIDASGHWDDERHRAWKKESGVGERGEGLGFYRLSTGVGKRASFDGFKHGLPLSPTLLEPHPIAATSWEWLKRRECRPSLSLIGGKKNDRSEERDPNPLDLVNNGLPAPSDNGLPVRNAAKLWRALLNSIAISIWSRMENWCKHWQREREKERNISEIYYANININRCFTF